MFTRCVNGAPSESKQRVSRIVGLLKNLASMAAIPRRERRLRICETLSLGEKRFLAVVEYGPKKFLLAGTPQNISLLQRLDDSFDAKNEPANMESSSE